MYSISIDFTFGNAFQWLDVLNYVVMLVLNSLDRWARRWLSHRIILSLESEILLILHICYNTPVLCELFTACNCANEGSSRDLNGRDY